jgi:hypothetical protein
MRASSQKAGWWLMELLLAITLVGSLTAAGVMAFSQAASWADGVAARNVAWQTDMVRLALAMQRDARHCGRILATDGTMLLYDGSVLGSLTHGKSVLAGDIEMWDVTYPVNLTSSQTRAIIDAAESATVTSPVSSQDFVGGWSASDSKLTTPDIDGGYASTLLFLDSPTTIYSAVYIKATPSTTDTTMTYTVERYESNGGRLVPAQSFTYVAENTTTTDDQLNSTSEHGIRVRPDYYEKNAGYVSAAPGCAYGLRLPSALSKGVMAMRTGKTIARVQSVPEFLMYLMPRRGEKRMFTAADWVTYWEGVNGY